MVLVENDSSDFLFDFERGEGIRHSEPNDPPLPKAGDFAVSNPVPNRPICNGQVTGEDDGANKVRFRDSGGCHVPMFPVIPNGRHLNGEISTPRFTVNFHPAVHCSQ